MNLRNRKQIDKDEEIMLEEEEDDDDDLQENINQAIQNEKKEYIWLILKLIVLSILIVISIYYKNWLLVATHLFMLLLVLKK